MRAGKETDKDLDVVMEEDTVEERKLFGKAEDSSVVKKVTCLDQGN